MRNDWQIIRLGLLCVLATEAHLFNTINRINRNQEYKTLYSRAETIAVHIYGDKKSPLDDSERDLWYQQLNVDKNNKPSIETLEEFIRKN
jgi:hypothetical protein